MKTNFHAHILTALLVLLVFFVFLPKISTPANADNSTDVRTNWVIGTSVVISSYSEQYIDSGNEIEVDINLAELPGGTTGCAAIENSSQAYGHSLGCSISGNTVTATFPNPPTNNTYPDQFFILFSNSSEDTGYTYTTFTVDPSLITTPPTTITPPDNLTNWLEGTAVDVTSYSEQYIDSGNEIEVDINLAGPPPDGTTGCSSILNPSQAYTGTAQSCSISGDTVTATFLNPPTDVTYPAQFFILFENYPTYLGYTYTIFTVDPSLVTNPTPTPTPSPTTLTPIADSYIKSAAQNENEGASTFMRIQDSGNNRALVKFDESQIAAAVGSDPNYTATLQFTITSNGNNWGGSGRQVDVDRMFQDWTEGNGFITGNSSPTNGTGSGVTWNCATDTDISNGTADCSGSAAWHMGTSSLWPFDATPTATTTITNNQTGTVSFDVTSDVQSFLNNTNINYGWLVKLDNEANAGKVLFGSKESSSSPVLIITPN